jgi:tetratricopeptide (TPR) repeat protein
VRGGGATVTDLELGASSETPGLTPTTPDPPAELPEAGNWIDQFRIQGLVGAGGAGRVYRAWDSVLGRTVALKLIAPGRITPSGVDAFLLEARTAARCRHPGVVVVHAVGTWRAQPYIAMEFLDGGNLRTRLRERLPVPEALQVGAAIAAALGAAHELGVVHCDLKPENVAFDAGGRSRIVDFGLAAVLDRVADVDAPVAGTPGYLAPERWDGRPASRESDVWAVGVVLVELFGGRPPGPTIIDARRASDLDRPTDMPAEIWPMVRAALALEPSERPAAARLAEALEAALREWERTDAREADITVGRGSERLALAACLEDAVNGRGGVVRVVGAAGIGKSHLMRDLVVRARRRGLSVLGGVADVLRRSSSYAPWTPIFVELLAEAAESAPEALAEAARARLPEALHQRLSLLSAVLPSRVAETTGTMALSGEARAEATADFLARVVATLCPKQALLVFDDLQWLDSASARLLALVAMRRPDLVVVVFERPGPERTDALAVLLRAPETRRIDLHPLASRDVRALVRQRLGAEMPVDGLISVVERRAGGNPFFAEQYARLLGGSESQRPSTEEDVLAARMRTLPPETAAVLRAASVVGMAFSRSLVRALIQVEPGVVDAALEELARQRLIVADPLTAERFTFHHRLTLDAAYASLEPARQRALHALVAGELEATGADMGPLAGVLTHHWLAAGDPTRAARYGELAARRALDAGANEEAVRLIESLLSLALPAERSSVLSAVRWRRMLAEAREGLGDVVAWGREAERALALAGRALPSTRVGWVWGLVRGAIRALVSEPPTRTESQLWTEISRIHFLACSSYFFRERALELAYTSVHCHLAARRADAPELLSRSYSLLSAACSVAGLNGVARRLGGTARELAEGSGDPAAIAWSHLLWGVFIVGRAEWAEAIAAVDTCQAISDRIGDRVSWCNAQVVRFWATFQQGRDSDARAISEALRKRGHESASAQHEAWGLRGLALVDLREGSYQAALPRLERARDLLGGGTDRVDLIPTLGALAVVLMRTGEREAALATARATLEVRDPRSRSAAHANLEGWSGVAEVAVTAIREGWLVAGAEVRALRGAALAQLRRHARAFPSGRPRASLWEAVAARDSGHEAAARRHAEKGLAWAERLEMAADARRLRAFLEGPG